MQPIAVPYVLTIVFSTVMAAILATAAWSRRDAPGATPFAIAMAFVLGASLSRILFVAGPEESLYFFARLRIVCLTFVPPFALTFVLAHTGHARWARPSRAWLYMVVPIAMSVLIWTNDSLFWSDWHVIQAAGARNEAMEYGVLWRVSLLYSYGAFIVMLGLLLRALLTSIRPLRSQTIYLIAGWAIVVFTNIPFAVAALGRTIPNLTNVGFAVAGLFFLTAFRRQGFLDRVPMALHTVYQGMQDAVVVFDVKRRIVAMNPVAELVFARTTAQVAGQTVEQALTVRPDLIERFGTLSEVRHAEVEHEGRVFDFDISPIVVRGEPQGHVLVIRDITERALAQRRELALTLEQERMRLLAGVIRDTSRELRTPLTSITSAVFMAQRAGTEKERKDRLGQIETEAAHMMQMIDTLQLLADLDVRTTLSLSEFTVRDLLETIPNTVRELIEWRGHKLVREFDKASPIALQADFYLLRAALQQLLHNAALYTPAGGIITVKAVQAEGNIEITVTDTGVGIAADALEAIFGRFTKLEATDRATGGAGVGLAIVKKVVELHGGSVTASSAAGRGSAFTMRLPLRAKVRADTANGSTVR